MANHSTEYTVQTQEQVCIVWYSKRESDSPQGDAPAAAVAAAASLTVSSVILASYTAQWPE